MPSNDTSLFSPTPEGHATADGRFQLARHYRRAKRGPSDQVRDGWLLTDTLTGATRWAATVYDATERVTGQLAEEAELVGAEPIAVKWSERLRRDGAAVEVWLVLSADDPLAQRSVTRYLGLPTVKLGLVAAAADPGPAVARLLAHLGLPSVDRLTESGARLRLPQPEVPQAEDGAQVEHAFDTVVDALDAAAEGLSADQAREVFEMVARHAQALADGMPKPHPLRYGVVTPEWNKVKPL